MTAESAQNWAGSPAVARLSSPEMAVARPPSVLAAGVGGLARALPGLLPTVLVLGLLGCVLVPLPTILVDLLLSLSLSSAVLLLVAALLVRRTTDFIAFPTLLLLVTLYRLALNVSTTRLILSQADAGRVVDAFATVVVRDDLLVGGVMFAIITIVQFVVIARGAERVAEVGARFALDGLPGSQAAIDADLRAKVISPREAAMRRAQLGERSNFYGAMDGAMRFVKGDAIAGLAITTVNLVGGVAIGAFRMDYGVGESLELYGRLTIGDGVLAQIPALLVSLAAGVLVSRVDRQHQPGVGAAGWLDPPMLLVPAAFLLLMAAVPGMPRVAFVITALGLAAAALLLTARRELQRPLRPQAQADAFSVRLSAHADERGLDRALDEVRARCMATLRVDVPECELVIDPELPPAIVDVYLGERRLARTAIAGGSDRDESIVLAVFRALMDNAEQLVDLERIDRDLDEVRSRQPVLVERALERVSLVELLVLVRALLRERIPRPAMAALLASVAEHPVPDEPSERARLPDLVRARLAAQWLPELLGSLERLGDIAWVALDPDAEEELLAREVRGVLGRTSTLSAADRVRWVARITRREPAEVTAGVAPVRPVAVLATPRARALLADLLQGSQPHVPVIATTEFAAAGVALPTQVDRLAPS